jgi:hypothetical protein
MLTKKTALLIPIAALLALPAGATQVGGVRFEERLPLGEDELRLHGVALFRYRVVIKAYAAALYLGEGISADRALEDVPRRLEIEYFWEIPAEAFAKVTVEGIARNVDAETMAGLRDRIERFNALYTDVRPGDRYALTYVPGDGTILSLNGVPRGSIAGADFARALFSIWLGEEPFDDSLKTRLLGRS